MLRVVLVKLARLQLLDVRVPTTAGRELPLVRPTAHAPSNFTHGTYSGRSSGGYGTCCEAYGKLSLHRDPRDIPNAASSNLRKLTGFNLFKNSRFA